MLLILAGLLLMLAVALLAYAGPRRPRQTMRSRMDTTSIDMRRADDGLSRCRGLQRVVFVRAQFCWE